MAFLLVEVVSVTVLNNLVDTGNALLYDLTEPDHYLEYDKHAEICLEVVLKQDVQVAVQKCTGSSYRF